MTREWVAGDVALVECSDGKWRRATFTPAKWGHSEEPYWAFPDGLYRLVSESKFRPLVVIDPEDREQVERLCTVAEYAFNDVRYDGGGPTAVDLMQAALRSLVEPPKPERPTGWGAVVEDNTGAFWTLYAPEADVWINYVEGKRQYASIDAVRILSPGVTS